MTEPTLESHRLTGSGADALADYLGWLAVRIIPGGAAQVVKRGTQQQVEAAAVRDVQIQGLPVAVYRPFSVMEAR